jgi:hypothetical protein
MERKKLFVTRYAAQRGILHTELEADRLVPNAWLFRETPWRHVQVRLGVDAFETEAEARAAVRAALTEETASLSRRLQTTQRKVEALDKLQVHAFDPTLATLSKLQAFPSSALAKKRAKKP